MTEEEFRNGMVSERGMQAGECARIYEEHTKEVALRDQFAMAALSGLLSDNTDGVPILFAEAAYNLADAMMAARAGK